VGDSNKLEIALDPAWNERAKLRRVADNARCPAVRAAISAMPLAKSLVGQVDLTQTLESLKESIAQVQAGSLDQADAMLVAQTETLDSLFHLLVARSNANSREGYLNASETYMRLALKAQAQARANWEAIWRMKQPAQGGTTFIKQANVANGPQQVNNAAPVSESENQPNELEAGK
jgi:hypothetical protein